MTIKLCVGVSPGSGYQCRKAEDHENRGQPACRNGKIVWCAACDRWKCKHVPLDKWWGSRRERAHQKAQSERWTRR